MNKEFLKGTVRVMIDFFNQSCIEFKNTSKCTNEYSKDTSGLGIHTLIQNGNKPELQFTQTFDSNTNHRFHEFTSKTKYENGFRDLNKMAERKRYS